MSLSTVSFKDYNSAEKEFATHLVDGVNYPVHLLGSGEIVTDAWGIQKVSFPHSLFHELWTFDIPASMWFMYEGATFAAASQVYTSTNIVPENGAAKLTANASKPAVIMESRQCPRYQPNRGHLFSSALWAPIKTADGIREWGLQTAENGIFFRLKADGKLYAVRKSGSSENYEEEIDTTGIASFDVEKGNVYDIQYQWRGVGNYKFFINLQLVHTIASLGTLTTLSMENPALPVSLRCQRTTADVTMYVGCADITSENGDDDREEPQVASQTKNATGMVTNEPVISIFNPLQINSETNTRTVVLDSIAVNSTIKGTFKVWVSRDPAHLTNESFAAVSGSGSLVQVDTSATAIGVGPRVIATIQVEAGVRSIEKFSDNPRIRFTLVRGDYLIVTRTTAAPGGIADVVIRWGEEI